jgi:predicted enzyme related to lactoylglutathione lyase
VIAGPVDTPVGRVAAVSDPQGAAFAIFEGQTDD